MVCRSRVVTLLIFIGSNICNGCSPNASSDKPVVVQSVHEETPDMLQRITDYMVGDWDNSEQIQDELNQPSDSGASGHPFSSMKASLFNDHIENLPADIDGSFILWRINENPWKSSESGKTALLVLIRQDSEGHLKPVIQEIPKTIAADLLDLEGTAEKKLDYSHLGHFSDGPVYYIFNPKTQAFHFKETYPISNISQYIHEETISADLYDLYITVLEHGWPLVGYSTPLRYRKRLTQREPRGGDIKVLTNYFEGEWSNKAQVERELLGGYQIHPSSSIIGKSIKTIGPRSSTATKRFILWEIQEEIRGHESVKTMMIGLEQRNDGQIEASLLPYPLFLEGVTENLEMANYIDMEKVKGPIPHLTFAFDPNSNTYTIDKTVHHSSDKSYYMWISVNRSHLEYYETERQNSRPLVGYQTPIVYQKFSDILKTSPNYRREQIDRLNQLMEFVIGDWTNRDQVDKEISTSFKIHPLSQLSARLINDNVIPPPGSGLETFVFWKRSWLGPHQQQNPPPKSEYYIIRYQPGIQSSVEVQAMKYPMLERIDRNEDFKILRPLLQPVSESATVKYTYQPRTKSFHLRSNFTFPNGTSFFITETVSSGHIAHYESTFVQGFPTVGYKTPLIYKRKSETVDAQTELPMLTAFIIGRWNNMAQIEQEKKEHRQIHPAAEIHIEPATIANAGLIRGDTNGTILIRRSMKLFPGRAESTLETSIIVLRDLPGEGVHRLLYDHPDNIQAVSDLLHLAEVKASGIYVLDKHIGAYNLEEQDEFHAIKERLSQSIYELFETRIYNSEQEVHYETPLILKKEDSYPHN